MARKDTYEQWKEDGELEGKLAIIQSLSMQGIKMEDIANSVGVSNRAFYRMTKAHPDVRKLIRNGRERVVAMVQSRLMDRVREGDTTAIIYSLKIYGGEFFNDRKYAQRTEVTGRDGGPIDTGPQVVLYLPQKDGAEDGE